MRDLGCGVGSTHLPLHFMTAMLAAVLCYNPVLVHNTGFQLSVAAAFGILLLRKPLESLVETTLLRFFKKQGPLSNLHSVSLAAQITTAPIVAAAFEEVWVIGAVTNLVAVPLSGPILTLGLLASVAGNLTPALAYPWNTTNGFLVTILESVARTASTSPFAAVTTPGITPPLVGHFYLGCIPAALCEKALPEARWPLWGAVLVLWMALWHALVGTGVL